MPQAFSISPQGSSVREDKTGLLAQTEARIRSPVNLPILRCVPSTLGKAAHNAIGYQRSRSGLAKDGLLACCSYRCPGGGVESVDRYTGELYHIQAGYDRSIITPPTQLKGIISPDSGVPMSSSGPPKRSPGTISPLCFDSNLILQFPASSLIL